MLVLGHQGILWIHLLCKTMHKPNVTPGGEARKLKADDNTYYITCTGDGLKIDRKIE